MDRKELMQMLLDLDGLNPSTLSQRLGGVPSQPQIYKFVNGVVHEPKRQALQPIADYYKISIEAFYDEEMASEIAKNIKAGKPLMTGISDMKNIVRRFSPAAEELAELLDLIPVHDKLKRAQAQSAAQNAILAVLQSVPATRSKAQRPQKQ